MDLEKENFDDMKVKLDGSEVAKEHLSSKLKEMEVPVMLVVKSLLGEGKTKRVVKICDIEREEMVERF